MPHHCSGSRDTRTAQPASWKRLQRWKNRRIELRSRVIKRRLIFSILGGRSGGYHMHHFSAGKGSRDGWEWEPTLPSSLLHFETASHGTGLKRPQVSNKANQQTSLPLPGHNQIEWLILYLSSIKDSALLNAGRRPQTLHGSLLSDTGFDTDCWPTLPRGRSYGPRIRQLLFKRAEPGHRNPPPRTSQRRLRNCKPHQFWNIGILNDIVKHLPLKLSCHMIYVLGPDCSWASMSQVNRRKCSPPRRPDSWSDRYHPIRDYQVGLDVAETFFGNVLSCQNLFKKCFLQCHWPNGRRRCRWHEQNEWRRDKCGSDGSFGQLHGRSSCQHLNGSGQPRSVPDQPASNTATTNAVTRQTTCSTNSEEWYTDAKWHFRRDRVPCNPTCRRWSFTEKCPTEF